MNRFESIQSKARRLPSFALAAAAIVFSVPALAQDTGGSDSGGDAPQSVNVPQGGGTGGPTTITFTPGSSSTTTTTTPPVGYPAAGTNLEGHLPSSSQAAVNPRDGFDLGGRSGNGGSAVRGDKNAQFVITGDRKTIPNVHTVRRGDTLWDLCARYYGNPWRWPKVWSYNPQVQNPHWIYPGDQVRMRAGTSAVAMLSPTGAPRGSMSLGEGQIVDRRPLVPPNTVFLRNRGYIDDPKNDVWGELVGAVEDQMLLSHGNHVYLVMRKGVSLRLGQMLTVFREVRAAKRVKGARKQNGKIVSFKGTVKIDQWDPRTRVARGKIVESLDVIERGARVGPVGRRFEVVPPRRNSVDLKARVLTSIYPHQYIGQNQVAFIDRGSDDGLRPGNRLFIVKKGDTWRRSLKTSTVVARTRLRMDDPDEVPHEVTPLRGDERAFPQEVVGELRVIRTRKKSSLTVVTRSDIEILPGDRAVSRKGY